jgi:hypothetical protein
MMCWSALAVVAPGLWVAGIPFFGPVLGLNMSAMTTPTTGMRGMRGIAAAATPAVAIRASTLWYHILPGALTVAAGLYQLVAPLRARARTATRAPSPRVSTTL